MTWTNRIASFRKVITNSHLLIVFCIFAIIGSFFLGAQLNRAQIWPFGQGYYLNVRKTSESSKRAEIFSVLGSVKLRVHNLPFADPDPSGPMEVLSDNSIIFVDRCGNIYKTVLANNSFVINETVDLNILYEKKGLENVYCYNRSSVKDSIIIDKKLYLSHQVYNTETNKVHFVVRELSIDGGNIAFLREVLRLKPGINEPFLGHQCGGRMVYDGSALIIAFGDCSKPMLTRPSGNLYGKIVRLNLKTLGLEIISSGHRSPTGGLFYDRNTGQLWETEHGPRGGDEINLILEGKNYGWPDVSYGTLYERHGMGDYYGGNYNTHKGYEKPKFVFLPSIGIGAIHKYPYTGRNAFFHGNYFFSGMTSRKLYRAKIENDSVTYVESVLDSYRIRDIFIDRNGTFYIKTDDSQMLIGP